MECDEITKLVDGVYKNILDKFNPGTRQFIAAGKGYLKALHGAAAASRLFNDSLAKIALNAQQSGTGDIGAALLNVVAVYKEIQEQQMNILKAFYVDLLVPLETNLEKDTKVVQHEQKKFMQQYKVRIESYQKAVSTMKKQRKKKSSPENTEKELRSLQILEDQKRKLDAFCEQSYKNAMTQERRRYGFVLERQCSIAKHWMAYHTTGRQAIDSNIENWLDVAASREMIPTNGFEAAPPTGRMERFKEPREEPHYRSSSSNNTSSQLKKSRSVDAPYGDIRTMHLDTPTASYAQNSLPRAKSDFNLTTATTATMASSNDHSDHGQWGDQRPVVKALYAYLPSGENQLPFAEGDRIALVGGKAKGWQFGENLRTQLFGWFPIAYTNFDGAMGGEKAHSRGTGGDQRMSSSSYENLEYDRHSNGDGGLSMRPSAGHTHAPSDRQYMRSGDMQLDSDTSTFRRRNHSAEESSSPTRMFGDTINLRNQKKYRATAGASNPRPGPPPTLPAPVPAGANYNRALNSSQSFSAPNGGGAAGPSMAERRKHKLQNGQQQQPQSTGNAAHSSMSQGSGQTKSSAAAKTSLHSSNDSGFANEPPPQPEIDYSDDEQANRVPIRRRADTNASLHMNRSDVVSWTLNRNFRNSVDSQMDDKSLNAYGKPMRPSSMASKLRYDLIASDDELLQGSSGGIKRTKSFWKFGGGRGGDHILEGMSLWQHRDLVTAPSVEPMQPQPGQLEKPPQAAEAQQQEQQQSSARTSDQNGGGTLTKSNANLDKRPSPGADDMPPEYDDEANIYVMSPATVARAPHHHQASATPKSRMKIMKTIAIDIEKPLDQEYSVSRSTTMQRDRDSTLRKQQQKPYQQPSQQSHHTEDEAGEGDSDVDDDDDDEDDDEVGDNGTLKMSDINNFFDDLHQHDQAMMMERAGNGGGGGRTGGGMIMKTVKRKDILKQYYTSEDDTDAEGEIKSTSSDPYDCIVINDHLVRKDEKHRQHQHHMQHQQPQQARHKSHATYQERHEVELKTFRAPPANANLTAAATLTKKTTKEGKISKQQQQYMDSADDSNRYGKSSNHMGGSSTLTRNSTASGSGNTNASMNSTPTATILPRTRLMKSSTTMTLERQQVKSQQQQQQQQQQRQNDKGSDYIMDKDMKNYGNTYGPWYDFWDPQEQSQPKQKQAQRPHNVTPSQKSSRGAKLK